MARSWLSVIFSVNLFDGQPVIDQNSTHDLFVKDEKCLHHNRDVKHAFRLPI